MMENHEHLYTNKYENLGEMDKFLDKLQKVTQKEIENLNRCVTNEETEMVIKTLLTKKRTGPNGFTRGFYQTFKE